MLKKNLFYNTLLSIAQFVFPLITFPYSSRILGPEGIGSASFIDSVTSYFILFAYLGVPVYGVREVAKRKNDKPAVEKFVSELLTIHAISVFICSIIYLTTALLIPSLRQHLTLVFVGIWTILISVFSVDWFFAGIDKFKYISIRSLAARILSVIFLFIFLKKGSTSLVYYLIAASGTTINCLINYFVFKKYCKLSFSQLRLKQHFKPLFTILGASLAVSVYILLDSIILGFMKGDVEVGLFSTATRIAKLPFTIIVAIGAVIVPQVSIAYKNGDKEAINLLIHKSFSFIIAVGLPISMGLFLEADFLISVFAGEAFKPSVFLLQLLSPLVIVVGLTNIFAVQLLTPIGKEKLLLKAVSLGMIVSVLLNLLLIPLLSYRGAGITLLTTETIVSLSSYLYVRSFVPINFDIKFFFQSFFGSLCFIPIAWVIRQSNFKTVVEEILVILGCVIFYGVYITYMVSNTYIQNVKTLFLKKVSTF